MKTLLLITLFSLSLHGQKSNEPEIVYPLLEQFIEPADLEIVVTETEVAPIPEE